MLETTKILVDDFKSYSIAKMNQNSAKIENCFLQLKSEQLWRRSHENENSLANLALHLSGNIRQWIVVSLGGSDWQRNRDSEFAARGGQDREALLALLSAAVGDTNSVIAGLTEQDLTRPITVQGYNVTGMSAVYHAVEHFSYHTGQIAFETKRMLGKDLGFYGHLSEGSLHKESRIGGSSIGESVP